MDTHKLGRVVAPPGGAKYVLELRDDRRLVAMAVVVFRCL